MSKLSRRDNRIIRKAIKAQQEYNLTKGMVKERIHLGHYSGQHRFRDRLFGGSEVCAEAGYKGGIKTHWDTVFKAETLYGRRRK